MSVIWTSENDTEFAEAFWTPETVERERLQHEKWKQDYGKPKATGILKGMGSVLALFGSWAVIVGIVVGIVKVIKAVVR